MKRIGYLLLGLLLLLAVGCDRLPVDAIPDATTTSTTTTTTTTETTTSTTTTTTTTTTVSATTTTTFGGYDTFTGLPPLEAVEYTVADPQNTRGLSTDKKSFSFGVAANGEPHKVTVNNQFLFDEYGSHALAWDNKSGEKVLYLTFDCGYKYKDLVPRILDTLKEKQVPAAFFGTLYYLETAPEEVARMIAEGHIVGNHTDTHPANCAALTREELADELLAVHNYLRTEFGYNSLYFRFPSGVYSVNALDLVDSVGYRSVFWSIAHADWDPADQPGEQVSFDTVTSRLHPGAVILLHSTSPDNAAILGDLIDYARAEGYTFRSLDDYDYWTA